MLGILSLSLSGLPYECLISATQLIYMFVIMKGQNYMHGEEK